MHNAVILLLALLTPLLRLPAGAQEVDLLVYSSLNGAGTLVVEGAINDIVRVTPRLPFCPGGICPYSSTNPGFVTPAADQPGAGVFALNQGTRVSMVVTAIHAAASVKIGGTVLDAAGESASLGEATGLHTHPEWQVQAPQGEVGQYPVSFKLTTSAAAYAESPVYTTILTNGAINAASPTPSPTPSPPPTATPSASATATAPAATATMAPTSTETAAPTATSPVEASPTAVTETPAPTATDTTGIGPSPTPTPAGSTCAGDCNGDGVVTISELITSVNMALGAGGATCPAVDGNGDGSVAINELIAAVNGALGGC